MHQMHQRNERTFDEKTDRESNQKLDRELVNRSNQKSEQNLLKSSATLFLSALMIASTASQALSLGMIAPHAFGPRFSYGHQHILVHSVSSHKTVSSAKQVTGGRREATRVGTKKTNSRVSSRPNPTSRTAVVVKPVASKPIPPQNFADSLGSEVLAPGVIHKFSRSSLAINILDIDMKRAPVKVQPTLAGESFDRLKDVAEHARESKAIAAVNANYFKTNGTPLGTLIIDGEWVAGPLFDRVSMGISSTGTVKIDRVSLLGSLTSDNPDVRSVWLNNINQPRRHGTHLVMYTRRWGSFVRMAYAGSLVAVDSQGVVQDTSTTEMGIPYGGFVLSDSKDSKIAKLMRGDRVAVSWQTTPNDWNNVVEAVSGGPMLIKDGKLFLDLKDENFVRSWTGSQIKARTAVGVTADSHLILATIEGPHTLWDLAKFLYKLGAVDAMNLDGGGSTTMVVNGKIVTRNANDHQRRVASSIAILDLRNASDRTVGSSFRTGVTPAAASFAQALPVPLVPRAPRVPRVAESVEVVAPAPAAPMTLSDAEDSDVVSPLLPPEPIQPVKHKRHFLAF